MGTSIAVPTSPLAPLLPRSASPLLPAQGGERAKRAMVNHGFVTDHSTAK
jgi:hypothetical protein